MVGCGARRPRWPGHWIDSQLTCVIGLDCGLAQSYSSSSKLLGMMFRRLANLRLLGSAVALTAAVLVTAVACQADVFVSVDENNDVTVVISVGVSDSMSDFAGISLDDVLEEAIGGLELDTEGMDGSEGMEGDGDGPLDFLAGVGGNEVTRYSEDGYSGYRISQTLPAIELEADVGDVEGIAAFAELVPEFDFRRTTSDDGWMISGDVPSGSLLGDLTGDDMGDGFGGLFGLATEQFDATLRVQLPGTIVESTAHRTENGIEVWDLLAPEGVTILVVSREPSNLQFVPWLIAGIFAVALVGIIIWQASSRRKRASSNPPDAPSQSDVNLNLP